MSTTETREYYSPGQLCQLLQRSPAEIRKAAESVGIQPPLRLNGIAYYADEQMEAIRSALPAKREKRG